MTIRNLNHLFSPRSIAVIGDGDDAGSPDACVLRNLVNAGFNGPVMPVHPEHNSVNGVLAYRDVASLPAAPDLAVITLAPSAAPALIRELGGRGTRAVMLLNNPLADPCGISDQDTSQAILNVAKPHLLRIAGPDRLGIAVPHHRLNATLTDIPVREGHIALVSQSSAVARSVMDWAASNGIGFSHVISVGAKLDVDFGDLLDYLALDIRARSILVYLEQVRQARKFMSAARIAARIKPVIVLKPSICSDGRIDEAVYDAAFQRAGILRVKTIDQLFGAVETLADAKPVTCNRLAIVSNSRSIAYLASDALNRTGGALATFSNTTIAALKEILPAGSPATNPVNLGEHACPEAYAKAVNIALSDPGAGGTLVLHSPIGRDCDLACARAVADQAQSSARFVLTCWIGADSAAPSRDLLRAARVPTYLNMKDAVRAFVGVALYRRNQQLLMETPPSIPQEFTPDVEAARALIASALKAGRSRLNVYEAMQVLSAFEIPVLDTHLALSPAEARDKAMELGGTVTLKVLIRGTGLDPRAREAGVALDSPAAVFEAATAIVSRVQTEQSGEVIEGFVLQPAQRRGDAYQLTIGIASVRPFGTVLRFGHGGTEADVIADDAYALPPLNMKLARNLISRTRIHARLVSDQGRFADIDIIAMMLIKVAQLSIDVPEIAQLDINPIWASGAAVCARHADIEISGRARESNEHLAIRPYPKELEQRLELSDGHVLKVRPIRPEDEPALQAMVRRTPEEDRRLRFFQPINELSHAMAARLTQIDYDREMALVITDSEEHKQSNLWGVVRMSADPDMEKAEYAIILDPTMRGQGLGPLLMRRIIDYASGQGIKEIFGEVLAENEAMLKLNRALGFTIKRQPDDPGVLHVALGLDDTANTRESTQ